MNSIIPGAVVRPVDVEERKDMRSARLSHEPAKLDPQCHSTPAKRTRLPIEQDEADTSPPDLSPSQRLAASGWMSDRSAPERSQGPTAAMAPR